MTWEPHYLVNLTCWENGNDLTKDYLYTCLEPCELVIVLAGMQPRPNWGNLEVLPLLICWFQDLIKHNEVLHIYGQLCDIV